MAWPATPLDVEVCIYLSGAWVDITAYVREGQKVTITRGRRSRVGPVMPARCTMTLDNSDGRFARFNPLGAYYGQIGKNTLIRVRVADSGSTYRTRFLGSVPGWAPEWDPSENDQTCDITAVSILDRLGRPRGRTVRSALAGSVPPAAPLRYYPMEDGASSAQFASGITGEVSAVAVGGPAMASVTVTAGSRPVAGFGVGATFTPIPIFGATAGYLQISFTFRGILAPSPLSAIWVPCRIVLAGGTIPYEEIIAYTEVVAGVTTTHNGIGIQGGSGGIDTNGDGYNPWDGDAHTFTAVATQNGADIDYEVWVDGVLVTTTTDAGDTLGVPVSIIGPIAASGTTPSGVFDNTSAVWGMGHLVIQDTPGITPEDYHAAAIGWLGEDDITRAVRLGVENDVPVDTDGTEGPPMGAQLTTGVLPNFKDLPTAGFGVLSEQLAADGVQYLALDARVNVSTAALTLAYDDGQILPPWQPRDDDQEYANSVTATRPGGSPYTAADDDAIAAVGLYEQPINPNVATDIAAAGAAGWQLHISATDELAWPAIRPNCYEHPTLLDDWLLADLGDQTWVTGHPSPLAPDTIKQIIEGYTEVFGSYVVDITIIGSAASPYQVGELDDGVSVTVTDGSYLVAGYSSSATPLTVATVVDSPGWDRTPADIVTSITVAGEIMTVTDVESSALDTFTRVTASGWGTADSGQAWTTAGGSAANYSTTGTLGRHNITTVGVARVSTMTAPGPDVTIDIYDCLMAVTPATAETVAAVVARYASSSDFYYCELVYNTDGSAELQLGKCVGGVFTSLGDLIVVAGSAVNVPFRISFAVIGSELRGSAWPAALRQPADWQVKVTDSSLTAAGSVGWRTGLNTGSTAGTTPITISDFEVINPQIFTVTRAVNGVSKAQTAGTVVRATTPLVLIP